MEIIECKQRSEEWYRARLGMVTASCFSKVLSKGVTRQKYMEQLIEERLTGQPAETYANATMRNGIKRESEALAAYSELRPKERIEQIGFVVLNKDVGGSPDSMVGEFGIIEVKCPAKATHQKYISLDKIPSQYKPQVQGLLWITGRLWADFVSYFPGELLWVKRIYSDACYIQKLNAAVNVFVKELKTELEKRSTDMNFQAARNAPGTIVQMQGIATTWDYKPQGQFGPYALADIIDTAGETQKVLISGSSQSTLPGPEVQNQPGLWGIKYDANTQKLKGYFNGYAQHQGQAPASQQAPPQQQQPVPQNTGQRPPQQAQQNYSQAPQNRPQATQAPRGGRDATGVSIERQCAWKSACNVANGQPMDKSEILELAFEGAQFIETGQIPYSEVASAEQVQEDEPPF